MKLKAPEGVGDPCVAGVAIAPRDGVYDVAPEIGVLLIECFGFVELEAPTPSALPPSSTTAAGPRRRGRPSAKQA